MSNIELCIHIPVSQKKFLAVLWENDCFVTIFCFSHIFLPMNCGETGPGFVGKARYSAFFTNIPRQGRADIGVTICKMGAGTFCSFSPNWSEPRYVVLTEQPNATAFAGHVFMLLHSLHVAPACFHE